MSPTELAAKADALVCALTQLECRCEPQRTCHTCWAQHYARLCTDALLAGSDKRGG